MLIAVQTTASHAKVLIPCISSILKKQEIHWHRHQSASYVEMLFESLELPPTADFHVHLRDGEMTEMIVPDCILSGGVDTVYVMVCSPLLFTATVRDAYCAHKPNLQPPIASVSEAVTYRECLQSLAPTVTFLMTLYLSPSITPSVISDAAKAGIAGVKSYPAGVTTYEISIGDLRPSLLQIQSDQRNQKLRCWGRRL